MLDFDFTDVSCFYPSWVDSNTDELSDFVPNTPTMGLAIYFGSLTETIYRLKHTHQEGHLQSWTIADRRGQQRL